MKLLKFSFAAIIAVGTLAVTLVAQAGLLNKEIAKAAVPDGCYEAIEIAQGTPSVPPLDLGVYDNSNINPQLSRCVSASSLGTLTVTGPGNSETIDRVAQFATVTNATSLLNPELSCPPEFDPFCCFEVSGDKVVGICFGEKQ